MLNRISTKPQVGILSIILSPIIFVIEVKAWLCPTINTQSKELFKFLIASKTFLPPKSYKD